MPTRRILLLLVLVGCSSRGGGTDTGRARATDTTRGAVAPADTVAPASAPARRGIVLPFRARGNEPGWSLDVGEREMTLLADYGERRIAAATPPPTRSGDTTRWAASSQGHELLITVVDRLCHDGMSGFPFPRTVAVRLDGRELLGCGGESIEVLVGDPWIVREMDRAAVPEDSRPTLTFAAGGRVSGRAGCNSFSASYALRGDELTFSRSSTTRMACAPAVMQREQRFLALLGDVRRFEHPSDATLVLHTGDGRTIVARR